MVEIIKSCSQCGFMFKIDLSNLNLDNMPYYCSDACELKSKNDKMTKCDICGNEFIKDKFYKSDNISNQNICSIDCLRKYQQSQIINFNDAQIDQYGYVLIKNDKHPFRKRDNTIYLHRLICEEYLRNVNCNSPYLINVNGKLYLSPNVNVIFRDGNKLNMSYSNLIFLNDNNKLYESDDYVVNNINSSFIKDIYYYSEIDTETHKFYQDLQFAKKGDACVDLRTKHDVKFLPNEKKIIQTGLYMNIPEDYEIQVRPRSGISFKTDLIFKNTIGTIDSGYKDEINVVFTNLSDCKTYEFKKYDRIAQLKLSPLVAVNYIRTDNLKEIQESGYNRGGGYGHTGLN